MFFLCLRDRSVEVIGLSPTSDRPGEPALGVQRDRQVIHLYRWLPDLLVSCLVEALPHLGQRGLVFIFEQFQFLQGKTLR